MASSALSLRDWSGTVRKKGPLHRPDLLKMLYSLLFLLFYMYVYYGQHTIFYDCVAINVYDSHNAFNNVFFFHASLRWREGFYLKTLMCFTHASKDALRCMASLDAIDGACALPTSTQGSSLHSHPRGARVPGAPLRAWHTAHRCELGASAHCSQV